MKKLSLSILAVLFAAALTFAAEKKVEMKVEGMTCEGCAAKVKTCLEKVEGVKSAEVSLEKKLAVVTFDNGKTNEEALKAAVTSAGFKAGESKECGKAGGCCSAASSCPGKCR